MFKPTSKRLAKWVVSLGLVALGASPVKAGLTPILPTQAPLGVEGILQAVYGSSASPVRIDDSLDQVWSGDIISSRALARFALFTQSLSTADSGGVHHQLDLSGSGLNVTGNGGAFSGSNFSFVRGGSGFHDFSSIDSANVDHKDHMVTFLIGEENGVKTYALFFEDLDGKGSDRDFNDLAVEVKIGDAALPVAVPLPAASWAGLTGMGVLGLMAIKRRAQLA